MAKRANEDKRLEELVGTMMHHWNIPGCSLAVFNKEKILYTLTKGFNSLESKQKMLFDAQFCIGSCIKTFDAAICMKLAEAGALDVKRPIKQIVKEFSMSLKHESETITFFDILSNKSCLGKMCFLFDYFNGTRKELFDLLPDLDCFLEYDHRMNYNNLFFCVLEYLIEIIIQNPFDDILNDFLNEIGLENTFANAEEWRKSEKRLVSYNFYEGEFHRIEYPEELDKRQIGSSLFMDLNDLVRWAQFQLSDGFFNGTRVISEESMLQMHSPQTIINTKSDNLKYKEKMYMFYGLGWFIQQYRSENIVYHEGKAFGGNIYIGFVPNENIGVAMVFNRYHEKFAHIIAYSVFDKYIHGDYIDWFARYKDTFVPKKMYPCIIPYNQSIVISQEEYEGLFKNAIFSEVRVYVKNSFLYFKYLDFEGFMQYQGDDSFLIRTVTEYTNIRGIVGFDNTMKVRFSEERRKLYVYNETNLPEIEYTRI